VEKNLTKSDKLYIKIYMANNIIINKYEKTLQFLEVGCSYNCLIKMSKEEFAKLHKVFQAFTKFEQDIFLMI